MKLFIFQHIIYRSEYTNQKLFISHHRDRAETNSNFFRANGLGILENERPFGDYF